MKPPLTSLEARASPGTLHNPRFSDLEGPLEFLPAAALNRAEGEPGGGLITANPPAASTDPDRLARPEAPGRDPAELPRDAAVYHRDGAGASLLGLGEHMTIIRGTDFSENAQHAVRVAAAFARAQKELLVLVHTRDDELREER